MTTTTKKRMTPNGWRNTTPGNWSQAEAREFVKHVMEPVTDMMAQRVLMILAASVGKELKQIFPAARNLRSKSE